MYAYVKTKYYGYWLKENNLKHEKNSLKKFLYDVGTIAIDYRTKENTTDFNKTYIWVKLDGMSVKINKNYYNQLRKYED